MEGFWRFFRELGSGSYLLAAACLPGVLPGLAGRLELLPGRALLGGEPWRAATYPLASRDLPGLLFQWLFLALWAAPLERAHGTLNLLLRVHLLTLIVAAAYLLAFGALWLLAPGLAPAVGAAGFFPLFFTELCADALREPWQPARLLLLPWPVPKLLLPALFLALDALLGQGVLRNAPCLLAGLLCFLWPGALVALPAPTLRRAEALLLPLARRLGTFYALNSKAELQRPPPSYTAPRARVGGAVLSEEQRRAQWAERYPEPGLADPEQPRPASPEAPLVAKLAPDQP